MKIKFLDGTEREIADLRGADLCGADLYDADLRGANLSSADLCGADLYGANLSGANLSGANLRGTDLCGANLCGADLYGADLYGADLYGANLRGADLYGANLSGANLRGADLKDAKGLAQQTVAPPYGAIIGFKKLKSGAIATLLIPADAKRVNAYGSRKCRAEFAYVQQLDSPSTDTHKGMTRYQQGALITSDSYDPDPRVACSHGIHFFITRQEAEEYS